jgi:hypothetical protein
VKIAQVLIYKKPMQYHCSNNRIISLVSALTSVDGCILGLRAGFAVLVLDESVAEVFVF